jgi:arsenate reductase
MPQAFTIYHNPRCSKSRQTLTLLQDRGIEPEVVLYLQEPPTAEHLQQLATKLALTPRQFLRKGEQEYKDFGLSDTDLSDAQLLEAMAQHPKLIERPIVIKGNRAVLGRPPENVLELIE